MDKSLLSLRAKFIRFSWGNFYHACCRRNSPGIRAIYSVGLGYYLWLEKKEAREINLDGVCLPPLGTFCG